MLFLEEIGVVEEGTTVTSKLFFFFFVASSIKARVQFTGDRKHRRHHCHESENCRLEIESGIAGDDSET